MRAMAIASIISTKVKPRLSHFFNFNYLRLIKGPNYPIS